LTAETVDLRRLEALLILGLAHPTILENHAISLRTEGERLAAMLEADGQTDRARCLTEVLYQHLGREERSAHAEESEPLSPEVEAEIDSYLKRADNAAALGRNQDAIRWLQEIVALDRNRRDVARMIRDLRWSEKERKRRNARRVKLVAALVVLAGLVWAGIARESYIGGLYKDLPAAGGKIAGMRARLASIDELLDTHKMWVGMTPESARLRGMLLAQQGHFEEAVADLRQALELADPKWPERTQVQANIAAIEAWMKKSR
jgi:tetratricopeptide (TPR) repeat protein